MAGGGQVGQNPFQPFGGYGGMPQQPTMQGMPIQQAQAPQSSLGPPNAINMGGAQYGWNGPQGPTAPMNSQQFAPQYPQLYGGLWNQLSQLMAGPQWSPYSPPQAANPTARAGAPAGLTPGTTLRGFGGVPGLGGSSY